MSGGRSRRLRADGRHRLLDLERHLCERGPSTLEELAARFDLEHATAEGALELLVRRGDVVAEPLHEMGKGCSGACSGACGMSRIMLYRAAAARSGR